MKRPPYLIRRVSRHGTVCWYVWRRPSPQKRLREPYGTKAFWAEYRAALYGEAAPPRPPAAPGSLAELIADYQGSRAWEKLAENTRSTRERILRRVAATAGDIPAHEIDRKMVVDSREKASTPGAAHHLVTTLRSLFKWAVDVDRLEENPAVGVAAPRQHTEGYHTWTDAEIARFEARWPLGTRQRLWMAIMLHTGFRCSDAAKLRWSDIEDGIISITAKKNKKSVIIPIEPELQTVLDAGPCGKVYVTEALPGEPYSARSISGLFGKACRAAGVPGSAHGLRKAQTTRLAYAGGTVSELNAAMGWTGSKMAMKYTETAERARLAKQVYERARKKKEPLPPSESGNNGPE